ncbi:MAG: hypothetical protein J6W13_03845 [Salinivirgaceae bacterium]|nr:hypothetical protein [Salinivirgaceae bacterium]
MKTIKQLALVVALLLPAIFQSCYIKDMIDEMENGEKNETEYSYSNEYGGKTTEYGTSSWATMAEKTPFINKFEAVGSDLNYCTVETGVRDGSRMEELSFSRATTDDEAIAYIKKMAADGYIFSYEDGMMKGYKVDSEGIKYEFEYGENYYRYRKTEISSLKKESEQKQYADDLKNNAGTKMYSSWTQIKESSPWLEIFPEVGGVCKLSKTGDSGNEVKLYGSINYETLNKLVEKAKADGFSETNWGESLVKEINGNRYIMNISDYDCLTFQRVLGGDNNGNNDIPNPTPSENQENNNENQNGEAPVDNGTPENNEENNGENNGGNNGEENNQQAISADDFNADGDVDWQDKFFKLASTEGVSTRTRKTYNGEVYLYNFSSSKGGIQIYDSVPGYDASQYYYDMSVDGGLYYKYEKGAWRYTSRVFKDRTTPADLGYQKEFYSIAYFAPTSWGVADSYFVTSSWTKVGSKNYAGRQCTEYNYSGSVYYMDDETDVCLYYKGGGIEFETLDFVVGTKVSVPEHRKCKADFPTNVKITTTDTTKMLGTWVTNLTIIKIGNEWMCTNSKEGYHQYWKFDDNGVTLKAMEKDDDDENWTSILDSTHWQDFDYFAQKCSFSFIFSNSTPKGSCYSECNPTSETRTVCGVECVRYGGDDVLNNKLEFFVNESNNVVYKAKDISYSEITGWDTSVTAFEIPAP